MENEQEQEKIVQGNNQLMHKPTEENKVVQETV